MKIQTKKEKPLKVVADGAIASSTIGDGRFIVVLIVDHYDRVDIEDLFAAHKTSKDGDVEVKWGRPIFSKGIFFLNIIFKKPIEVEFDIELTVDNHAILIETILNNKAVYIQLGKEGEKLKDDVDKQKILIEIPDTGIKNKWRYWWKKSLIKKLRKKGHSKKEADKLSGKIIEEIQQFKKIKMP